MRQRDRAPALAQPLSGERPTSGREKDVSGEEKNGLPSDVHQARNPDLHLRGRRRRQRRPHGRAPQRCSRAPARQQCRRGLALGRRRLRAATWPPLTTAPLKRPAPTSWGYGANLPGDMDLACVERAEVKRRAGERALERRLVAEKVCSRHGTGRSRRGAARSADTHPGAAGGIHGSARHAPCCSARRAIAPRSRRNEAPSASRHTSTNCPANSLAGPPSLRPPQPNSRFRHSRYTDHCPSSLPSQT